MLRLASDLNDLFKELQSNQVKIVGNYQLGETIGQGTYGKVKLATHVLTGQQVAVKIVAKTHASIITREIYHWRTLAHPNIAHLHEVLTTESKIYLVTEHCRNGELLETLIRDGRCSPALARKWFRQICLAVQHCHSKKIVHRDLKLENILLDEHNDIKLIDFGFTRECESKKLLESYCGSAAYTAPEIIMGTKYSGPEADIWSLGIILYTLLAGYLPFDDENEAIVQDKIVALDYEMPDDISQDAKRLIQDILKPDPPERLAIDQILNHAWFTPGPDEEAEHVSPDLHVGDGSISDLDLQDQHSSHGRQGSLVKRDIHPIQQTPILQPVPYPSSPLAPSPVAPTTQNPWTQRPNMNGSSPYTFQPCDSLRAGYPHGTNMNVPSPISSPLPSPSPMVNKTFPRFESYPAAGENGAKPFPSTAFEQRLLQSLVRVGLDPDAFSRSIPAQSCDPAYGLWSILIEQVKKRSVEKGTTMEWEQMLVLSGLDAASHGTINDSGRKSPRPMSDPSPSSSAPGANNTSASLMSVTEATVQYEQLQKQRDELQAQTDELRQKLEQQRLEVELLKVQKSQLEGEQQKQKQQQQQQQQENASTENKQGRQDPTPLERSNSKKANNNDDDKSSSVAQPTASIHPLQETTTSSTAAQRSSTDEIASTQPQQQVLDSGVSVSTNSTPNSTPNSSWEIAERASAMVPHERPRRKSKGILTSLKERFFSGGSSSDADISYHAGHNSPTPLPLPSKKSTGTNRSAPSSTVSGLSYAPTSSSSESKPLPAPPAHPHPHPHPNLATHQDTASSAHSGTTLAPSTAGFFSVKSASTTSLVSPTTVLQTSSTQESSPPSSTHSATTTTPSTKTTVEPIPIAPAQKSQKGFVSWIVESASGTVLNKSPVPQSSAKVNNRVKSTRSYSNAEPIAIPGADAKEVRPQIPDIPQSFFQPTSPPTSGLASSAPSNGGMSLRQRLASFSGHSTPKISAEERKRAAMAAALAAQELADSHLLTRPERAHSPSPPSSPPRASYVSRASDLYDSAGRSKKKSSGQSYGTSGSSSTTTSSAIPGPKRKSKDSMDSKEWGRTRAVSESVAVLQRPGEAHDKSALHRPRSPSPPRVSSIPRARIESSPLEGGYAAYSGRTSKSSTKSSISGSKSSMPSIMTAFAHNPFRSSKSATSSPVQPQKIVLPVPETSPAASSQASPAGKTSATESTANGVPASSVPSSPPSLPRSSTSSSTRSHIKTRSRRESQDIHNYPIDRGAFADHSQVEEGRQSTSSSPRSTKLASHRISRSSITRASLEQVLAERGSPRQSIIRGEEQQQQQNQAHETKGTPAPAPAEEKPSAEQVASKRASLGSLSSRRSSSSSMRDRNIFGLTIDSTAASRKSSIQLQRAPSHTSPNPNGTPTQTPRRGSEYDRSHSEGYGSPQIGRSSITVVHEDADEDQSAAMMASATFQRRMSMQREERHQRQSSSGSRYSESNNSPVMTRLSRELSESRRASADISESGLAKRTTPTRFVPSDQEGHPKEVSRADPVQILHLSGHLKAGISSISPSVSASSSLNQLNADYGQQSSKATSVSVPNASTAGANTTLDSSKGGESSSVPRATAALTVLQPSAPLDEEVGSPKLRFEEGCSLIPSPPASPQMSATIKIPEASIKTGEDPADRFFSSSPSGRPLVTFDERFQSKVEPSPSPSSSANNDNEKSATGATSPATAPVTTRARRVTNGFQPMAAKRLSKPGVSNSNSNNNGSTTPVTTTFPLNASIIAEADHHPVPALSHQFQQQNHHYHQHHPLHTPLNTGGGPPNAFAGRRRGYRNSTGSMASMSPQQQQHILQLQQEQLQKIQGGLASNAAASNSMVRPVSVVNGNSGLGGMNHRSSRLGMFPKREYGGMPLGGHLQASGASGGLPTIQVDGTPVNAVSSNGMAFGSGVDLSYLNGPPSNLRYPGSDLRDTYVSRRQSMGVPKRTTAPAAIQEEEE
ncbi:hypothetical protein BGW41_000379 [Actinomortierella wolfii]|nr:hypothetical protein BGW41_000379 [Actinomortierella wolfii]